jgi:hypothetical protein
MFVQPKSQELARLEQQIAAGSEVAGFATPQGVEALAARLEAYGERLESVRRCNGIAEDTSALYGTIMDLAGRHEIRVQSLQPSPLKQTDKNSPVKAARLTISVQGNFASVSRFLDDVAGIDAFIRPVSLQMTPADDARAEAAVNVHFGCDVLAFDTDNVLKRDAASPSALAGGASHVGP